MSNDPVISNGYADNNPPLPTAATDVGTVGHPIYIQHNRIDIGVGTARSLVTPANPLPTSPSSTDRNGTWTVATVTGSSGTLLAANTARKRFSIIHNSSGFVYVKFGSGGSSASYNIILYSGTAYISDLYEYAGVITYETSGGANSHYIGEEV